MKLLLQTQEIGLLRTHEANARDFRPSTLAEHLGVQKDWSPTFKSEFLREREWALAAGAREPCVRKGTGAKITTSYLLFILSSLSFILESCTSLLASETQAKNMS